MEVQVTRACEEGGDLYRTKNAEDETTWEEAKRETKAELYGFNKRGYEGDRTVRSGHKGPGEVKTMHPL